MMWKWRRHREAQGIRDQSLSRETRSGTRLAREVEAFLSGLSGEWFIARGRDVPAWAYVNQIAHSEPGLLWQLAAWQPAREARLTTQPDRRVDSLSWRGAAAVPASEIPRPGGGGPGACRQLHPGR